MDNKFHVGDVVHVRSDVLFDIAGDPSELTTWYYYQNENLNFVVTQIDESHPDAPYMLDKFFCETHFSGKELTLIENRPCAFPIGTKVRINPDKIEASVGELADWFKHFGDADDMFTIIAYSSKTGAPYVLDRYMGETSFFERELIPV